MPAKRCAFRHILCWSVVSYWTDPGYEVPQKSILRHVAAEDELSSYHVYATWTCLLCTIEGEGEIRRDSPVQGEPKICIQSISDFTSPYSPYCIWEFTLLITPCYWPHNDYSTYQLHTNQFTDHIDHIPPKHTNHLFQLQYVHTNHITDCIQTMLPYSHHIPPKRTNHLFQLQYVHTNHITDCTQTIC